MKKTKRDKFPEVTEARPKSGGQAFPVGCNGYAVPGMTLRDYFAAKAMAAIISKFPAQTVDNDGTIDQDLIQTALGAYHYADAMLKSREAR